MDLDPAASNNHSRDGNGDANMSNDPQSAAWEAGPEENGDTHRLRIEQMVEELILPYRLAGPPQPAEPVAPTVACAPAATAAVAPAAGTALTTATTTATAEAAPAVDASMTLVPYTGAPHNVVPPALDNDLDINMDSGNTCSSGELVGMQSSFSQVRTSSDLVGFQGGDTVGGAPSQGMQLMGRFVRGVYTVDTDAQEAAPLQGAQQVPAHCTGLQNQVQDVVPVQPGACLTRDNEGFADPQPVRQGPKSTFPYQTLLKAAKVEAMSAQEAVFVFGVLAVLKKHMPLFEYVEHFDRKWMARLVFAGITICNQKSYGTKFEAKADACRDALNYLKPQFNCWAIPPLPWDDVAPGNEWHWSTLLQDYCTQRRLERPDYTAYTMVNRFRYEVDVGGSQYFSVGKSYETVTEAIHASAQYALYCILLDNNEGGIPFSGGLSAAAVTTESPHLFAARDALNALAEALNNNPATANSGNTMTCTTQLPKGGGSTQSATVPATVAAPASQTNNQPKKKKAKKKKIGGGAVAERAKKTRNKFSGVQAVSTSSNKSTQPKKSSPKKASPKKSRPEQQNANLVAITPNKLRIRVASPVPSPVAEEQVTPGQVVAALKGVSDNISRAEIICELLKVERPTYHITPWRDERGLEYFDIEAYFKSDPYLRRAGVVAKMIHMTEPTEVVQENCAGKVVDFLLNVVREQCGEDTEMMSYVVDEKENGLLFK